jgi:hypothetical protein
MVASAKDALTNVAIYNLRDAAGQTQQDLANSLNRLGARDRKGIAVIANQVSRWERGITHPSRSTGNSLPSTSAFPWKGSASRGPGWRSALWIRTTSDPIRSAMTPTTAH